MQAYSLTPPLITTHPTTTPQPTTPPTTPTTPSSLPLPLPLTPPPPLAPLLPTSHHSLKGPNQTKGFVKSHLSMSINLPITQNIISDYFLQKNILGQNRLKVGIWRRRLARGKLRTCNVVDLFFHVQYFTPKYLSKRPLFHILNFQVPFVFNYFCC